MMQRRKEQVFSIDREQFKTFEADVWILGALQALSFMLIL
jgi:hypothetical protein